MQIDYAEYIASYVREDQCPKDKRPEFAFIGRSNVGKSSLINMLTMRKELAKVSKQPGKTQALNYFDIDHKWYLVDLPGYGYAKISQKTREKWQKMIHYFLANRESLCCAFILIDGRHELQKLDQEFLGWCGEAGVPLAIVYTKADKVKLGELNDNISGIEKALKEDWEELPPRFITSADTGLGRKEILDFIEKIVIKS